MPISQILCSLLYCPEENSVTRCWFTTNHSDKIDRLRGHWWDCLYTLSKWSMWKQSLFAPLSCNRQYTLHNWLYVETTSEVPLKAKGARRFSSSQSTPGMDIVGKDDQPKGSTGNTIASEGLSATVHYYLQIVMLLILDTSNLGLSNDLYVNQVEEVHLSFQNVHWHERGGDTNTRTFYNSWFRGKFVVDSMWNAEPFRGSLLYPTTWRIVCIKHALPCWDSQVWGENLICPWEQPFCCW